MPVNYLQLQSQIHILSDSILNQREKGKEALEKLTDQFKTAASLPNLAERVSAKLRENRGLSCALPRDERIDSHISAGDHSGEIVNILAADGSQINPSRHEEVSFGLINTAIFKMRMNGNEAPQIVTETKLIEREDDSLQEKLNNEANVGLFRDVEERRLLSREACKIPQGELVVALTDGPLQLYYFQEPNTTENPLVNEYYKALAEMSEKKIITAGYTDRPRSTFVIDMLRLLMNSDPQDLRVKQTLVFDSNLFSRILLPGERSALFKLISPAVEQMPAVVQISFFYLNVGNNSRPMITRIEIPEWVSKDPAAIDLLHYSLLQQNGFISSNPYPYALHRAHECAVVQFSEKEHVKQLIIRELLSRGVTDLEKSAKQIAKDLFGTTYRDFEE